MSETRKPVVVAVVVGAVVVVLFALGVGLGGGDGGGAAPWRDRLGGIGAAGGLDPADVTADAGCVLDAGVLRVAPTRRCVLSVAPRGGGLRLGSPVRRAVLVNGDARGVLTLSLADTTLSRELDPGEEVSLTFGPDGGSLELACRAPFGQECTVALAPPG